MKAKGYHQIVKRYGKALFEAVKDSGQLDVVARNARVLRDSLNKDALSFFQNPVVADEAKRDLILSLCSKLNAGQSFSSFLILIWESGRFLAVKDILKFFLDLADRDLGILRVQVTSSRALTGSDLEEIETKVKQVTGHSAVIENLVSPDVIAGYVLKIGDTVIDCSLRNQLKQFSASIFQGV